MRTELNPKIKMRNETVEARSSIDLRYGRGTWVTNQGRDMGNTFRARSASERRVDQCPGRNRYRWIKKLNLSPNISATPSHSPSCATDTASVAKPATNGSIAIRRKAPPDWLSALADHIHLQTKRLSLYD